MTNAARYIAYAFVGRKEVRTGDHATRLEAAFELFNRFPKMKSCSTCKATIQGNVSFPNGQDIRTHGRGVVLKALEAEYLKLVRKERENLEPKPYPFPNGLIIHVNSFTRKMDSGYIVENGAKSGKTLTAREVAAVLSANWEIKVAFCNV